MQQCPGTFLNPGLHISSGKWQFTWISAGPACTQSHQEYFCHVLCDKIPSQELSIFQEDRTAAYISSPSFWLLCILKEKSIHSSPAILSQWLGSCPAALPCPWHPSPARSWQGRAREQLCSHGQPQHPHPALAGTAWHSRNSLALPQAVPSGVGMFQRKMNSEQARKRI